MISAYKIGVSIALSNGMSSILAVIQKDVLGLNKAVNLTNGGFDRMKLAAIGLGAVTIGGAMLGGLYELSRAGEKYTHQLEQMKLAGFSLAEQQDSIAAANRTSSSIMTTNPTENLQAIRELRGALNSAGASPADATKEAIEHLEMVQRASAVMTSALGENRGSDVFEMVKALEDIGATKDPARFDRLLNGFVQSSITFGGRLTGKDFFQTLKYTRGAGAGYSDEFIEKYLPTLMQELKAGGGSGAGGGAGNPLASLFQVIVGGNITNKAEAEWQRMGLIDPSKVLRTSSGSVKGILPGGFYGSQEAVKNPYFYIRDVLLPALQKKGDGPDHPEAMREELAHLFGNRVAQQMAGLLLNISKMEGDRKLTEATMTMDQAYSEAIKNDPVLTRLAAKNQWERIEADLGKAITPAVNDAIFKLAEGLAFLAEVIEAHPIVTKWMLGIVAALGGLLVVAGTIAITVAAIGAIGLAAIGTFAVAGLLALGAAIIWLYSKIEWRQIGAWMAGVASSVAGFFADILRAIGGWGDRLWNTTVTLTADGIRWAAEIVRSLKDDLASVWDGVLTGLVDFVDKLGNWVRSIPARLAQALGSLVAPGAPGASSGMTGPGSPDMPFIPNAYHVAPGKVGDGGHNRIENIIYLDGKQIHHSMKPYRNRDVQRPRTTASSPDNRLNLLYAT